MLGGCAAIGVGAVLYRSLNRPLNRPPNQQSKESINEAVNKQPAHHATLSSLVDTIVPADEFPGALDLKLDDKLFDSMNGDKMNGDKMNSNKMSRIKFKKLAESIDNLTLSTERKKFTQLNLDQRETLLEDILKNDITLITRHDLYQLRSVILKWYYSTQQGRQSLGYLLPSDYPAYQS